MVTVVIFSKNPLPNLDLLSVFIAVLRKKNFGSKRANIAKFKNIKVC